MGSQKEIRDYATVLGEQIIKPLFPIVWEAFEDYRLGGMTLTRLDILMVVRLGILSMVKPSHPAFLELCETEFKDHGWDKVNCRERNECRTKLERLGLL